MSPGAHEWKLPSCVEFQILTAGWEETLEGTFFIPNVFFTSLSMQSTRPASHDVHFEERSVDCAFDSQSTDTTSIDFYGFLCS